MLASPSPSGPSLTPSSAPSSRSPAGADLIQRRAFPHEEGDVGDVDADFEDAVAEVLAVQRVVEIARRRRIHGKDARRPEVEAQRLPEEEITN